MAAGATYTPIATTTLGSTSTSIGFSSIPSTYTDLRLIITGTLTASGGLWLRLNNETTGTNYSDTELYGNGTTATSTNATNNSYMRSCGSSFGNTRPVSYTADLFSYANSRYKSVLMTTAADMGGSGFTTAAVGIWRSTSAINQVDVWVSPAGTNTWAAGTIATLYGITKA